MKKETTHSVRTGDVGALTTLGSSVCSKQKRRMMAINF
jgi:hypothetical protein